MHNYHNLCKKEPKMFFDHFLESVSRSVGQSASRSVCQLVSWSVGQSVSLSVFSVSITDVEPAGFQRYSSQRQLRLGF